MQALNLPEYDVRIEEDQIFCLIRKKWLMLTPEEWVRQHFLNLMINHLDYPRGMIRLEQSMHYFRNQKRSDIVLLNADSSHFLLVECKSTSVQIGKKVVSQISQYNKILNAKFIAITNGMNHFVWEKMKDNYLQLNQFPAYTGEIT